MRVAEGHGHDNHQHNIPSFQLRMPGKQLDMLDNVGSQF